MKSYSKDKKYKKYKKYKNLLEIENNTNAYYKNLISRQQIYIFNLNKTIENLKEKYYLDEKNQKKLITLESMINSLEQQIGGVYDKSSLDVENKIDFLYDRIANLMAKQKSLIDIKKKINEIKDLKLDQLKKYSDKVEENYRINYHNYQKIIERINLINQGGGAYNSYIYYLMNDLLIILRVLQNYPSNNIKILFKSNNIKQFIIENFNKNKDYLKILDQLYNIYQIILNISSIKLVIKINNFNDLDIIINKLNIIKKYI
jgi:hypothetical protein